MVLMLRRNINTIASSLSVVAPTVRADKKSCESEAAMPKASREFCQWSAQPD